MWHPEAIADTGGRIAVVLNQNESVEIIDLLLVQTLQVEASRTESHTEP